MVGRMCVAFAVPGLLTAGSTVVGYSPVGVPSWKETRVNLSNWL